MKLLVRFILGAAVIVPACGGSSATPMSPPSAPSPPAPAARGGHAMAHDAARGQVLLFGGNGVSFFGDLWGWNGRTWTQLSATGPAPRDVPVLAYDSRRQRLVLYGGRTRDGAANRAFTDTWEWDGARWTQREVTGPSARVHPAGAFDARSGRLVLYGGIDSQERWLTDTWEWDGQRWRQRSSAGPADCLPNGMDFDATRGKVLLLCANAGSQRPDGTFDTSLWEWNGTWLPVNDRGPVLSPIQATTSLGEAGGILLFDGGVAQGNTGLTWRWDGARWTRLDAVGPQSRNGHALAYDPARGRVVLFGGGRGAGDFADTWEWDGARWVQVNLTQN